MSLETKMVIVAFMMAILSGTVGYGIGYSVAEEIALQEFFEGTEK